MALALAASLDPPRLAVHLVLSGIPAGADTFTIERAAPSGNLAGVRGAVDAVPSGSSAIVRDYEAPLNQALLYTATVLDGGSVVATASVSFTVTYEGCEAWLVDLARPTNTLTLTIEAMEELAYEIASGVHRVLNRRAPVMVSLPAWTPAAELSLLTDTLEQRDRVRWLLGSGFPFLLRTDPAQGIGNMYLGVTGFVEDRFLTDGYAAQRRFRASVVQLERPDPSLFAPVSTNTYANVHASYASYAAMQAAVGTYDVLAYIDPATGDAGPVSPWLPDDV